MNLDFARAWLRALSESAEAAAAFYLDEFDFADVPLEQFIRNDKAMLKRAFAPFANKDRSNGVGIHTFEAVEYIGDDRMGLVVWKWQVTHAGSFFGLPTGGKPVSTTGTSFHVYREGRIAREIIQSDQIHPMQTLGYPVQVPHYWEEGFQAQAVRQPASRVVRIAR